MITLTNEKKRQLIGSAHSLKPVVMLGNQGVTENIIAEIDRALFDHELIKIKISGAEDKSQKITMANEICHRVKAECLRIIGNIAILYRSSDKKKKEKINKNK
jgi:RNA-binding protein